MRRILPTREMDLFVQTSNFFPILSITPLQFFAVCLPSAREKPREKVGRVSSF
jgi:hypothetical protein